MNIDYKTALSDWENDSVPKTKDLEMAMGEFSQWKFREQDVMIDFEDVNDKQNFGKWLKTKAGNK